jgi:hypothetical protein
MNNRELAMKIFDDKIFLKADGKCYTISYIEKLLYEISFFRDDQLTKKQKELKAIVKNLNV